MHLEEIPAGFTVGGNLMLRYSSVRRICEDVVVGGMVSVNSDIARELQLSENAAIAGGLYFSRRERRRTSTDAA